jgi:hypothetical protein
VEDAAREEWYAAGQEFHGNDASMEESNALLESRAIDEMGKTQDAPPECQR